MQCNAMQCKNAFYLASSRASKSVQEWAAHAGLSVSPKSIKNIQNSLVKTQRSQNMELGHTRVLNLAYDNCDFRFGVGQPTDLNEHTFESITTSVFLNPNSQVLPEHLEYTEMVWAHHHNNPDATSPYPEMASCNVVPTSTAIQNLMKHCQWHIKAVFMEEYLPGMQLNLGQPPSIFKLSPEKMMYSTAKAVYAKASTIDGNIEALMSLLEQSGIIDVGTYEKYMILVHGDLGLLEKIETILRSRSIEEDILECMHYLLPIPGLFHVRMACVDAINRIYASGQDLCDDPNGLYRKLTHLFPNDITKLNKSIPPFRMMNDGMKFITDATILDAWRENVGEELKDYVESKPAWEDLEKRAKVIMSECFETKTNSYDHQHNKQCDE